MKTCQPNIQRFGDLRTTKQPKRTRYNKKLKKVCHLTEHLSLSCLRLHLRATTANCLLFLNHSSYLRCFLMSVNYRQCISKSRGQQKTKRLFPQKLSCNLTVASEGCRYNPSLVRKLILALKLKSLSSWDFFVTICQQLQPPFVPSYLLLVKFCALQKNRFNPKAVT